MFLFCGVFYPLEALPPAFQKLAWVFPLTPVNSIVRSISLGLPTQALSYPLLVLWLVVLVLTARRAMFRRLVK